MPEQKRSSFDRYVMDICKITATRSTCLHRHQGTVIVKDKRIIATGYNGSAPGQPHCSEVGTCAKEKLGMFCRAEGLHGENNAILSAAKLGISVKDADMYCIYSPCRACCNMMKAAGIKRCFYQYRYESYKYGPEDLMELGIEAIQLE